MRYKYAFYVHHHGSGHITRALAIASKLPHGEIVFFGSDLLSYKHLIPTSITCIYLPMDTPGDEDKNWLQTDLTFLHYAPINIDGVIQRNRLIIDFFAKHSNCLLVVDVSVEITLLARLCGIPTVVVRQHGDRVDLPHALAYESAALILAPYSKILRQGIEDEYEHKTLYSGGFSKYVEGEVSLDDISEKDIAIFFGKGGTCFDQEVVEILRKKLPEDMQLHVLGHIENFNTIPGVTYYGNCQRASDVLKICTIVICNAGHNCIMELGSLRKKIICIPSIRPFDEQKIKAKLLADADLAVVIEEEEISEVNWAKVIDQAKKINTRAWEDIMNPHAIAVIAEELQSLHTKLFKSQINNQLYA